MPILKDTVSLLERLDLFLSLCNALCVCLLSLNATGMKFLQRGNGRCVGFLCTLQAISQTNDLVINRRDLRGLGGLRVLLCLSVLFVNPLEVFKIRLSLSFL